MEGDTAAGNLKPREFKAVLECVLLIFYSLWWQNTQIQETSIKEMFILSHSLVPHGGHIASAVKKPGGDCP